MKKSTKQFPTIIRDLIAVLKREKVALSERSLRDITALTAQKAVLLKSFDDAVATMQNGESVSQDLETNMSVLCDLASENCERLKALSAGVSDARKRLEKIKAREQQAGAYTINGDARKIATPSAVNSKI
ncbi:MAG: hypothetical protein AAGD92_07115 [Pseudomonadota bacterium]